jgi:hypothetical protein
VTKGKAGSLLRTVAAIAVVTVALGFVSSASARVTRCGPVVPPIPTGQHEEFTFYKVDASDTSCRIAIKVAERDVALINADGFRSYDIDGFKCRFFSEPTSGPTVRCTKGRADVLGYNGGE